jgi:DNA-binding NarL/FixJ family response regulator
VLLCDDSPTLATLVDHWLQEHDDLEYVGAVQERHEAAGAAERLRPDVVLLDTMGAPQDSSVLEGIRALVPDVRVIVYSGYVGLMGPDGIALPADGFLDKSAGEAALVEAIRRVAG